jgi:DNA-binding NtrC family response regulator
MISLKPQRMAQEELYEWHVVVIVDDDPHVLAALQRALDREPYDVIATDRPQTVLEWVGGKEVSLVIADQRMPEMDGSNFLEEVWKRSPTTAGVLITGYPETAPNNPAFRQRLQGLVVKPWNDEILKRTLRRLLRQREVQNRSVM